MDTICWADPLTRAERRKLSEKLARACKRFYAERGTGLPGSFQSWHLASAEMADLHLDVTERAEVPAR